MGDDLKNFGGLATGLSRSPLGIIALFIVLVYGLAALVLMLGKELQTVERMPLIWFLVIFPVLVLAVFTFLLGWKQDKLIWPSDFKDEGNYIRYTREREMEVAAALSAAEASRSGGATGAPQLESLAPAIRSAVSATRPPPPGVSRQGAPRTLRLLWVDDRPSNNELERQAFEAAGMKVTVAVSTEEALELAGAQTFAAIISDFARPEGPEAGLDLLRRLRAEGRSTPFFVYSGSSGDARREAVLQAGGQGITESPQRLFEMVTQQVLAGR